MADVTAEQRAYLRALLAQASGRPWLKGYLGHVVAAAVSSADEFGDHRFISAAARGSQGLSGDRALIIEAVNRLEPLLDALDARDRALAVARKAFRLMWDASDLQARGAATPHEWREAREAYWEFDEMARLLAGGE